MGERQKVLDEVSTWAGADPKSRSPHRALTPEELVRLAEGGLIDVGAHTVTHPVLSALPATMQKSEIQGSKTFLEEILAQRVATFAYPYGSRADYTEETVAMIREAGFANACSNFPGLVWRGADRYQLPRFMVLDWDGEGFARKLDEWFRG